MGVCRIQKPTQGALRHGDVFIKTICDGIESEVIKYEGDKGDLYLNLICEEEESATFYLGKKEDNEELKLLKIKVDNLETLIDSALSDLTEFENYILNNPIPQ